MESDEVLERKLSRDPTRKVELSNDHVMSKLRPMRPAPKVRASRSTTSSVENASEQSTVIKAFILLNP